MKTKKKALLLLLCAATLVIGSVFGTMAYLTDTDAAENTFTIGSVGLKLDEAWVNVDGKPIDENGNVVALPSNAKRVTENSYHLLPGHEYTKDPTVTVDGKSEDAYVRLLASITYQKAADSLFGTVNSSSSISAWLDIDGANWVVQGNPVTTNEKKDGVSYITRTYEFRYKTLVETDGENPLKLEPLFTKLTVPGTLTNDDMKKLENMRIDIEAHAIQADGFDSADDAWKAFAK